MKWQADGYILSVRPHGETSAIVNVLTKDQGRHAGLVRGGRSRRLRPVLQPGNQVNVAWNARLSEHLGTFTVEALDARAAVLMEDRLSLAALNAVCALSMQALPEREPHPKLYDVFEILLAQLHDKDVWPAIYVRFEIGLLQALGYGLDLSACAATGAEDNLTHVSPRSGRAVCAGAAEPYLDKLLPLPPFLQGKNQVGGDDIMDGLALSEYFLKTRVFYSQNKDIPEARARMVEMLGAVLKNPN
ncbi:MAG: DNA repair protein RecO [Robiginitomaculum sp.]|nr:DNA repair protein RecO [Robiginitomaculum sp.]